MGVWIRWGLAVAVLAVPRAADAQDEIGRLIGRPVAAIRFEVEGRPVTSSELESLIPFKSGDPLSLEAVRDAESHLVNAKQYDHVEVTFADTAAGIDLLFKLTPRHPVDRLEFTGDTGLPSGELERLVRERYGGLPAREQPRSVGQVLAGLLRDEGFPDASIEARVVTMHDPDRATLVLNVAAGTRSSIARTEVSGQSPLSTGRIIELTNTAPGRPFRRADIEARLAAIEDDLRKQGYFSAVAILPNESIASESPVGLIVSLLIEAGPRVTLRWEGATPPGDEEDFVPMRRQRSVDEDLLEDSDERVASYWRREGYKDVKVTHTRELQNGQLVITIHVDRSVRYVIDEVRITGNAHLPDATVRQTLGVRPGAPYDESRIVGGIARLRTSYLQLGYHHVAIKELDPEEGAAAQTPGVVPLVVLIDVAEGPQARIRALSLVGVAAAREAPIRRLVASRPGALYVFETLRKDRDEVDTYYRNLGFGTVDVRIAANSNVEGTAVDVSIDVAEGPQVIVGDIRVVGNRSVSEEAVQEQITLRSGQPFGEAARRESARRLYSMGVFRQVSVEEEPRASGDTVSHVLITVEELPATSIGYGGGVEGGRQAQRTPEGTIADRSFVAPRGFFEIGRRNLWGRNRSIDFFSRVAPRPATTTTENFGFLEYRVSGTYREPRAFNSDTDVTLGVASEQAARTGFNFARRSTTVQLLRRLSSQVSATGRYALEYTRLFDVNIPTEDRAFIDRLYPQVRLSTVSGAMVWDRRDDLVSPSRGTVTSAEVEVAARGLGSQVGFAKIFLQTSGFRALTATRRVVAAGRAEVGIARGFERTATDERGRPILDEQGQPRSVADVPVSERFFAGGSTTVRGFQLDRLGVPGEVITPEGLPRGGNGVVILNAELRTTIGRILGREFGVAAFTDAGNVFPKASDIDLGRLRATAGFGIRYNSPLGPVRLDFGFKTDRQIVGGRRERGWEYHFNIGEAF